MKSFVAALSTENVNYSFVSLKNTLVVSACLANLNVIGCITNHTNVINYIIVCGYHKRCFGQVFIMLLLLKSID